MTRFQEDVQTSGGIAGSKALRNAWLLVILPFPTHLPRKGRKGRKTKDGDRGNNVIGGGKGNPNVRRAARREGSQRRQTCGRMPSRVNMPRKILPLGFPQHRRTIGQEKKARSNYDYSFTKRESMEKNDNLGRLITFFEEAFAQETGASSVTAGAPNIPSRQSMRKKDRSRIARFPRKTRCAHSPERVSH